MKTEVNLHPSTELLNTFVQGELCTSKSVVVSAHLDICKSCGDKSKELQALAVSSWVDPSLAVADTQALDTNQEAIVANIIKTPQIEASPAADLVESSLSALGITLKLPRVLAKLLPDELTWKTLPGGISEAQLQLDGETQCEFIYMAPGSKAPVHTHTGTEMTLVLQGGFRDELGEYGVSDFIVRDTSHQHQPVCDAGCLCFAVLDSPLKFTQGLARLMNPINRFRFKRALATLD